MVVKAEPVSNFSDIENHWALKQINDWVNKDLVGGYTDGTFQPDHSITRAEFIALVNRAFGYKETRTVSFSDVSASDWFASEVAKASAVGYIAGYPDGTFQPNNSISRQEAAAVLAKVLKPKAAQNNLTKFTDNTNIPSWSRSSINATVEQGYMGGYPDNSFGALNSITRAESIAVLDRAVGILYNKAGVYDLAGATISTNVTISNTDITLKNAVISGNLYLTEGIGDGHVTLDNVQVQGATKVSGGGENSIIIINSSLGRVVIDTTGRQNVRLIAQGSTTIGVVEAESGAKLEEDNLTGTGFAEVIITVPEGASVELIGDFDEVNVESPHANINVQQGTIGNITLAPATQGTAINLAAGATVNTFTAHSAAQVTGTGTIQTANINASGVTLENKPETIVVAEGVEATVAGENMVGEPPSATKTEPDRNTGGSSGGSRKVSVDTVSINPEKVILEVGKNRTITAIVEPDNATNKKVTWESSDEGIATVDEDANVTAVASGTAFITAVSAADKTKIATCTVTVANDWSELTDIAWYIGRESESEFTLKTAEELAGLAELVNRAENPESFAGKTIILGGDIDLLDLEWIPIGNGKRSGYTVEGNSFQGDFDGNNKTITNLKITPQDNIDGGDEYAYGLIGSMIKGSLKDLTISTPQINGTGYSNGAVVGFLSYGYAVEGTDVISVENCTVVGGSIKGHEAVGGIIGRLIGSKDGSDKVEELRIQVVDCVNQGTTLEVTSNNAAGGIVGNQYRTNNLEQVLIKDCENSGDVISPHMAGGIVGQIANGTLDGGTNTGTIVGGYSVDKGFYNAGHLIGYSTGAKIRDITELFALKNVLETAGGMPIYIELTGEITATEFKGETNQGATDIDQNSITFNNCKYVDIIGDTTLTVANGKTIYLYTDYHNTVRGLEDATLTIAGEGNVNVGATGNLMHFYTDEEGITVAADESGNVIKGTYNYVLKSGDNTNRNQEIWVLEPTKLEEIEVYEEVVNKEE